MGRSAHRPAHIALGEYRDTGCLVSPRCMQCPLPCCIEEMPEAERRMVLTGVLSARVPEPPVMGQLVGAA